MSIDEDFLYIKNLIGKHSYKVVLEILERAEAEMAEELKTLFKFDIFELDGIDYITSDNFVSFMQKLNPYILDFELETFKVEGTKHGEDVFVSLEFLLRTMRELDERVDAFNLNEIATNIGLQSSNKEMNN